MDLPASQRVWGGARELAFLTSSQLAADGSSGPGHRTAGHSTAAAPPHPCWAGPASLSNAGGGTSGVIDVSSTTCTLPSPNFPPGSLPDVPEPWRLERKMRRSQKGTERDLEQNKGGSRASGERGGAGGEYRKKSQCWFASRSWLRGA